MDLSSRTNKNKGPESSIAKKNLANNDELRQSSSSSEYEIPKKEKKQQRKKNASHNNWNSGVAVPLLKEGFYREGDQTSSAESQAEATFDFKGSESLDKSKQIRKKKFKKKNEKQKNRQQGTSKSSDSDHEPLYDKLEQISKSCVDTLAFSGIQLDKAGDIDVRLMFDDSDTEETNPSKTEYFIRTLDPSHNRFKVASHGVQTDWSWLRDGKDDDKDFDMKEILEKLKFGLHGGLGPLLDAGRVFSSTYYQY